jgi:hypothetical protein
VGIALVRLPAYEVDLFIYTGRIDPDQGLKLYSELGPGDPANSPRWLTYIDQDADFSGIPVTAYAQARHIMAAKLKPLSQRPGHGTAAVCSSAHCEFILDFWRAFSELDPDYVSRPAFFTELKDACDWLNLPEAGRETIAEAVRARLADAEPLPNAETR